MRYSYDENCFFPHYLIQVKSPSNISLIDSDRGLDVNACDNHSKNQEIMSEILQPTEIQNTNQMLDESSKTTIQNGNDLSVNDSEILKSESETNVEKFADLSGMDIVDDNKQAVILLLFTCYLISCLIHCK